MVLTEEERRERKRIYNKKYRETEKGKEKKRISNKKYRESESELTKEKRREYNKKYTKSEKGKESRKKYNESQKGKETIKNYTKSEKNKEAQKRYYETQNGIKSSLKNRWKSYGLNMENFEEIYKRYQDAIFCDICECVLQGNGRNRKCMDHDHDTGEFRNVVCNYCNVVICK